MGQKFLIDSVKQNLDDIRDAILADSGCCVIHHENGFHYAEVISDGDDNEYMLCVTTEAEHHLTQPQIDALIEEIPVNFLDDSI